MEGIQCKWKKSELNLAYNEEPLSIYEQWITWWKNFRKMNLMIVYRKWRNHVGSSRYKKSQTKIIRMATNRRDIITEVKWSQVKVAQSCPTLFDPMDYTVHGQNTGVSSLSFSRGIFPTQGSNPDLQHCRQILYQLSHKGSPL